MENTTDSLVIFLGVCLGAFILIALLIKFVMGIYVPFITDRDYIKMEIVRSHGKGRRHWEKELKKLYLSQIPLVGGYLANRVGKRRR